MHDAVGRGSAVESHAEAEAGGKGRPRGALEVRVGRASRQAMLSGGRWRQRRYGGRRRGGGVRQRGHRGSGRGGGGAGRRALSGPTCTAAGAGFAAAAVDRCGLALGSVLLLVGHALRLLLLQQRLALLQDRAHQQRIAERLTLAQLEDERIDSVDGQHLRTVLEDPLRQLNVRRAGNQFSEAVIDSHVVGPFSRHVLANEVDVLAPHEADLGVFGDHVTHLEAG